MIQALLGHQRLDTTAHYTRVATDLISKVVSPLDYSQFWVGIPFCASSIALAVAPKIAMAVTKAPMAATMTLWRISFSCSVLSCSWQEHAPGSSRGRWRFTTGLRSGPLHTNW